MIGIVVVHDVQRLLFVECNNSSIPRETASQHQSLQAYQKRPKLSDDLINYALYHLSIGFEGMGHWESEALISNFSLRGTTDRLNAGLK